MSLSPIFVVDLLPSMRQALLELLRSLDEQAWQQATICAGWSVKDVALHLLGGEIGILSRKRDGFALSATIHDYDELVAFVNQLNAVWVEASRRFSTPVLCDLMEYLGQQTDAYFKSLEPLAIGEPVSWAGSEPAPVWLDIAREYTERWHHQQHIRDAVGQAGLKDEMYFRPVIETFIHALPQTYRHIDAPFGTIIRVTIKGKSGSEWSLMRYDHDWKLSTSPYTNPITTITVDEDVAWRLFTGGIERHSAEEQLYITGDMALGQQFLNSLAIIA